MAAVDASRAQPKVPARKPTIADKRWAQAGQDLRFNQVRQLRAAAEQWRNGLTGLTALLSVAAVVKGADTVDGLTTTGRVATAVAAGLALASLLFGSWCAMRAAFGVPGERVLLSSAQLKRWSDEQVRDGVADLTRARWSFLIGVVLLATAIGITWFNAPADVTSVVRVILDGEAYCGTIVDSSDGRIVLDDGGPADTKSVVPLRDVQSLVVVPSCD